MLVNKAGILIRKSIEEITDDDWNCMMAVNLSGGRLILGMSLGGRDNEFEPLGVSMQQRVSRLRENLTVMRKLWTEPQVTFHGRYYHMDNVRMAPKPVQKPDIPVLMGGHADAVRKRSAEEADGWIAGGQGIPEAFREAWQWERSSRCAGASGACTCCCRFAHAC